MIFADRVSETSTSTGTGALSLGGASSSGYRTFAAAVTVGQSVPYAINDASGNWEIGYGTLSASTTLTRDTVLASSNANALVNFPAGSKTVFITLPAALIAQLQTSGNIAFSATVPLTAAGTQYMPPQTVGNVIAFTPAANPVQGASVYVRLTADGTNAPTFSGFTEWGGSMGYDNRPGIVNVAQFFYDGATAWYSVAQAANATPSATAVTMTGPTSGTVSVASSAFTIGANGALSSSVTVTPSDNGGGGSFSPASVTISSGTPTATFTYTPSATVQTDTISVTNNGGLTNPANISYAASAAAPSASVVRFSQLSGMTESGSASNWIYTGTSGSWGGEQALSTTGLQSGVDGSIALTLEAIGNDGFIMGPTTSATPVSFGSLTYGVWASQSSSQWKVINNGSPVTPATPATPAGPPVVGDKARLRRAGTTLYVEVYRAANAAAGWQTIHTFTGVPTTAQKFGINMDGTTSVDSIAGSGLA